MTVWRELTVQTVARVAGAPSRSLGRRHETLGYLPGSALRGALAATYLQQGSADDASFQQIVDGCRFAFLQPAGDGESAAYPLPLSAFTCSHQPGFVADAGHGVVDALLLTEAQSLASGGRRSGSNAAVGQIGSPASASDNGLGTQHVDVDALPPCARCQPEQRRAGPPAWQPARGLLQWRRDTPRGVTVRVEEAGGRPVGRLTGSADGATYVQRALAAGQRFTAPMAFPEEQVAALVSLQLAPRGAVLHLGAGRSRGLGAVAIEAWREMDAPEPLDQRINGLNARLRQLCERAEAPPPEQTHLTLTLRAPAILRDTFGRFRTTMSTENLARLLSLPPEALTLRRQCVGHGVVEGWNAALGLPKPDDVALDAGSCWLFSVEGAHEAAAREALARLEDEGIGARRSEGFGAVSACDPAHWRLAELEQEPSA